MTTTLVVRFVLGRYHATPWGRHVNEGQVELPPSPWRLLRALYAVWKLRRPELDEATVRTLLTRLAVPPDYYVPPHRVAHTRHYYPDSKHRRGGGTPSVDCTLDAFAAVDRDVALGIRWKVDLPAEERKALAELAEALPYLGRADGLCEAAVDDVWEPADGYSLWSAVDVGESISVQAPAATLLAPTLPLDFDALVQRPVDVRAHRLLFPGSTRFVGYLRSPLGDRPRAGRRRHAAPDRAEAVRFTVTSRVLPPDTDTVVLTDLLRYSAIRRLHNVRGPHLVDSRLAGKDDRETPMSGHEHAHFLAVSHERRIVDLVVWAPGGLVADELDALGKLRVLSPPADGMPGPRKTTIRISGYGKATRVLPDLAGPSTRWRSATPFVPPRHQKRDWADFLCKEIVRELDSRGFPTPVEVIPGDGDWQSYVRYRPTRRFDPTHPDRRPAGRGAFLELVFAEPVNGPVALGHLSHFGLGLFTPVRGG